MRLALAVAALAALAGVLYLASPERSLRGLGDALEAGDREALERHVDFPLLRRNLKQQLVAQLARESPGSQRDPFGALARGVTKLVADQILDTIVTPTGIAELLRGARPFGAEPGEGRAPRDPADGPLSRVRFEWASHDRVLAFVENDFGDEVQVVLRRYGLRWRLVDIRIPLGESGPGEASISAAAADAPELTAPSGDGDTR